MSTAELEHEIREAAPLLSALTPAERTAQVAAWAGRARALPDGSRLLSELATIARHNECGWIDALHEAWTMDWHVYVTVQEALAAGLPMPHLAPDKLRAWHQGQLRALAIEGRPGGDDEKKRVIDAAAAILPANDPDLAKAREPGREAEKSPRRRSAGRERDAKKDDDEEVAVDERVLAITRGARILMVGGQGRRPQHERAYISTFGFGEFEWYVMEREANQATWKRWADRMRPGLYDLVIFLAAYTGHASNILLNAIKAAKIPIVYVPAGYSVAAVANAILEQRVIAK
jgi:hypothetical protein